MIIEGYRDAAVSFASELERDLPHSDATTSTSTSTTETGKIDFDSIHERMLIRESIEAGRIDEAVRRVNELDSEVSVVIRAFSCSPNSTLSPTNADDDDDDDDDAENRSFPFCLSR